MNGRFKGFEFWDGVAFGALVGVNFSLLIGMIISGPNGWFKDHWEALAALIVTLFAAFIALGGPRHQIDTQLKIAERNRSQDLASAKAVLPLALSKAHDVAELGFEFSLQSEEFYRDADSLELARSSLSLDDSVISFLRDCIRTADPNAGAWLATIVQRYQISRSRLIKSLSDPSVSISEGNRASHGVDWALMLALIDHAFPFSRTEQRMEEILDPQKIVLPPGSRHFGTSIFDAANEELKARRIGYGDGRVSNYQARRPE